MSFNQVAQPLRIQTGLYPHQLTSIYNMKQLEQKEIIEQDSKYIKYNFGFLSDKSGFGKTLSVIGLISLDERNNTKDEYVINKDKQGNKYMFYYTMIKTKKVDTSLVVIRPDQFAHWETELKKTNLSYFTAVKHTDIDIENYDVILCSSKLFNYFCTMWYNIQWKRVIFDEPMSLKLKKQDLFPFSDFYWFMTPSPYDLLSKKCPVIFEPMFCSIDYDLVKNVIVKNNDDYIHDSFSMPKTNHVVHHYTHNIANALKGMVSNCVMELINAGNYETAIEYINTNRQEKDDLLSALKDKSESMYDTVVKRLCDSVCPICTECIDSPILFTCCYNVYCDKCISDWIHIKKSCPMCRETTDVKNVVSLIDKQECASLKTGIPNEDVKTREELFKDIIRGCKKTVVFCNYEESFRIIKKILDYEGLQYGILNRKQESRSKIIESYVNGDLPIMLLKPMYSGYGINLENTTDIILYHDMNEYTRIQSIGRANRIGRTTELNVHYLKMY
jgi:SNF2 family DNA or RNA helicase